MTIGAASAGHPPLTRMRGEDRRGSILQAAMQVFGDYGYVGATTAQIARAAGVSQPYVVQTFGTKEQLFLAVIEQALDRLLAAFAEVVETPPGDSGDTDSSDESTLAGRLGAAYVDQLEDRGLLLSLMHAFVLGRDPVIGRVGREGFMKVYRYLRDVAGFSPQEVRGFLAEGMLINTMVGLRMIDDVDTDPDVEQLLECSFEGKLDKVRALAAADVAGSPG
ncbi:TetR/AcrR family transcriptional regulator [Subtercola boreus]|nr:TetR/AcrR family transcriptional regulator [Subtercola boreus]